MTDTYKVIARVIYRKGTCPVGHDIGDEFIIDDLTPQGMCSWAFYTLFPFYSVLKYGGTFPWETDPNRAIIACPDPSNVIHFELKRHKYLTKHF